MLDKTTHVQELKDMVAKFVGDREWAQFHSPKNLSMSIAIEAAELMELFQWVDKNEQDSVPMSRIKEELADVVIYCISTANTTGIDLAAAIKEKVAANAKKYPVERYKGIYK